MSDRIDVLDHGYIRMIDSMGSDLSIVRAARVSHDADWRAGEDEGSDARLIRYLWKHRHSTPFESVTVTFEVAAPIFVFRQWHRHRTQSYSEQSARYSELPETFYLPDTALIGVQSNDNKQARDLGFSSATLADRDAQRQLLRQHNEASFALYRNLLSEGWPRELARTVLPVATYSRMFATANLLNWFRFLTLRAAPDAQYEIRVYADAMLTLLRPIAPVAVGAWEKV
jgi:thymidylate synthase (FAD)